MSAVETTDSEQGSLAERLRARIKHEGPVTFHDWMAAALYDPAAGYYCRSRQRWGRMGDYRTSPELSPLFAATFARYFARLYDELEAPAQWTIVEAGAGNGQFAAGVLANLRRRAPLVFAATQYIVDELSESSRTVAARNLAEFGDRVRFAPLTNLERLDGVIFSNELLDAFPVHRVTSSNGQLKELYVCLDSHEDFAWEVREPSRPELVAYLDFVGVELAEGQIAEINLAAGDWLKKASRGLRSGYLVTVDYGADATDLYRERTKPRGTLRGFSNQRFVDDPLKAPGEHDLTTTVDWTFVRKLGASLDLATIDFQRQDEFLMKAGLLEELEAVARDNQAPGEELRLRTRVREMILPTGMAASFQVLVQKKTLQ